MKPSMAAMTHRPRRNRASNAIRELTRETSLESRHLILPLFVTDGRKTKTPIASMPGQNRLSVDLIVEHCKEALDLGIQAVTLFPVIPENKKDPRAKESMNASGLLPRCINEIKAKVAGICVISDVAMDPYSSDGHDGLLIKGEISNDQTLPILGQMALIQAQAGADIVAPSDMMDGRVKFIRACLDRAGYQNVGILSYAAKYASAFYGPFREALDSAPGSGDKKTYQMDAANKREAIREVLLDCAEGADIVMVKPALAYLDVISAVRKKVNVPVAAYQVSGEYAMIKAAEKNGWIDGRRAMAETLVSIRRAGADMVLTYFALEMARDLLKT